ncbi:ParB/RepB/Spo0J family partition protein [candidate division KSB1 bacterium]|nr:ParB/RepB/Spo0J family partition protein [candidate division KSB1 bacterium]
MQPIYVNPETIDTHDTTYNVTHSETSVALKRSIQAIGVTNPVILEELQPQRYRIICGRRRVHAALQLQLDQLPVKILRGSQKPSLEFFRMNLYENSATRQFEPIEIATIALKLARSFLIPQTEIAAAYFPLLGLGQNPKLVQMYLEFDRLEQPIKQGVNDDFMGIEMATKLLELPQPDRLAFFQLAYRLKLGKNRQRELLNYLIDISKRNECSFAQIIEVEAIHEILENDRLTLPQQAECIRHFLKVQRYPRYSATEKRFGDLVTRMKLPGSISLVPFPYFEQSNYTLIFTFTNHDHFKQQLKHLQQLAEADELRKLDDL